MQSKHGKEQRVPLDKAGYKNLERLFRAQVDRDRAHAEGRGVYLPCLQPEEQVDYIFVGMEPSFRWANGDEDAEKMIRKGFRNFWGFERPPSKLAPNKPKDPLRLFMYSIDRFLCQSERTYHLTDLAKGAMPVKVAVADRDRKYKEWYPLLMEEIAIVGKPKAPVVAFSKEVEGFLQRRDLEGKTGRPLHRVLHYSNNAVAHRRREAERDREGFEAFKTEEFGNGRHWPAGLSLSKEQLIFTYKKQFEAIQPHSPK